MDNSEPVRRQYLIAMNTGIRWGLVVTILAMLFIVEHIQALPVLAETFLTPTSVETDAGREPNSYLGFLFAAFFVTWLGFLVYLMILSHRGRELRREIEILRQTIIEREKEGSE